MLKKPESAVPARYDHFWTIRQIAPGERLRKSKDCNYESGMFNMSREMPMFVPISAWLFNFQRNQWLCEGITFASQSHTACLDVHIKVLPESLQHEFSMNLSDFRSCGRPSFKDLPQSLQQGEPGWSMCFFWFG